MRQSDASDFMIHSRGPQLTFLFAGALLAVVILAMRCRPGDIRGKSIEVRLIGKKEG